MVTGIGLQKVSAAAVAAVSRTVSRLTRRAPVVVFDRLGACIVRADWWQQSMLRDWLKP